MKKEELPESLDAVVLDEAIRARVNSHFSKLKEQKGSAIDRLADSTLEKFVLTAIIGGAPTIGFQAVSDHFHRKTELRDANRVATLLLLDTLGGILDRGYYSFSRKFDERTGWVKGSDSTLRADSMFRHSIEELESRETVFAAKVCAVIDSATAIRFWNVSSSFRNANYRIRNYDPRAEDPTAETTAALLKALQNSVIQFTAILAEHASNPSTKGRQTGCPAPGDSLRAWH